jgi:hypothetical protein
MIRNEMKQQSATVLAERDGRQEETKTTIEQEQEIAAVFGVEGSPSCLEEDSPSRPPTTHFMYGQITHVDQRK